MEITPEIIAEAIQFVNPRIPTEFALICAWQIFDHVENETYALATEQLKLALDYSEQDTLDYLESRD